MSTNKDPYVFVQSNSTLHLVDKSYTYQYEGVSLILIGLALIALPVFIIYRNKYYVHEDEDEILNKEESMKITFDVDHDLNKGVNHNKVEMNDFNNKNGN